MCLPLSRSLDRAGPPCWAWCWGGQPLFAGGRRSAGGWGAGDDACMAPAAGQCGFRLFCAPPRRWWMARPPPPSARCPAARRWSSALWPPSWGLSLDLSGMDDSGLQARPAVARRRLCIGCRRRAEVMPHRRHRRRRPPDSRQCAEGAAVLPPAYIAARRCAPPGALADGSRCRSPLQRRADAAPGGRR